MASQRTLRPLVVLLALLPGVAYAVFVRDDIITEPRPERFSLCKEYSCKTVLTLSLTPTEWQRVVQPLALPASGPRAEREHMATVIRNLERLIGPKTGTDRDQGGTFPGTGKTGQMDCIDEATNTTTYLRMLAHAGLLRRHRVLEPAHRGFFLFGWPHTTAVVEERDSGRRFAVDAWFHGNGEAPEVVPLEEWKDGWKP